MSKKSQNRPTVFAETNFIFDCVFDRDVNAQYLLELVQQDTIVMSLPRFAFAEAEGQSEVIIQRRIENLQLTLSNLRELRRSRHREEEVNRLSGSITELVHQLANEINEHKTAIERMERSCHIIPYNMEIQGGAVARIPTLRNRSPRSTGDVTIDRGILAFLRLNAAAQVSVI